MHIWEISSLIFSWAYSVVVMKILVIGLGENVPRNGWASESKSLSYGRVDHAMCMAEKLAHRGLVRPFISRYHSFLITSPLVGNPRRSAILAEGGPTPAGRQLAPTSRFDKSIITVRLSPPRPPPRRPPLLGLGANWWASQIYTTQRWSAISPDWHPAAPRLFNSFSGFYRIFSCLPCSLH